MHNTYIIQGGIGKNAFFSSLIPSLSRSNQIQIVTPYTDCFFNNPGVVRVYDTLTYGYNHPDILRTSTNIYAVEPYNSNFLFGKTHIIESYCDLLNVDYTDDMVPDLYTDSLYDTAMSKLREAGIRGKYMLVQFTGGQSPVDYLNNKSYTNASPLRNYPAYLSQRVIDKLKKKYPDVDIIDASLPNEPSYNNAIKWTSSYWILLHELLKHSQGFIGIDSCLNHFSASSKTPGVVLWGSTKWTQFGYTHNTNIQNFMKPNKWDNNLYDRNDPRNIMIDPDDVVEQYDKIQKKKTKNVIVKCCTFN